MRLKKNIILATDKILDIKASVAQIEKQTKLRYVGSIGIETTPNNLLLAAISNDLMYTSLTNEEKVSNEVVECQTLDEFIKTINENYE